MYVFIVDVDQSHQVLRKSTDRSSLSLPVLIRELKGVNWFDLGTQLNIPQPELKILSQQYSDPMRCLTEMLNTWLDANPTPNWAEIVVALKCSSECDLATKLASKYCSRRDTDRKGKLYNHNLFM